MRIDRTQLDIKLTEVIDLLRESRTKNQEALSKLHAIDSFLDKTILEQLKNEDDLKPFVRIKNLLVNIANDDMTKAEVQILKIVEEKLFS